MQKRTTTILLTAIVAGVIAIGAVYASNYFSPSMRITSTKQDTGLQTAGAEQFCQTREEALANTDGKIQIKEPTYLPTGYKFVCADSSPDIVLMFYGDGSHLSKRSQTETI